MALVLVITMVSVSFGQWVLHTGNDSWTDEKLYTGINQISNTEQFMITSKGLLGMITTYSISSDLMSEFTVKTILIRTPDGSEYSVMGIAEPSIINGMLIFPDNSQTQLIELMKQHAWIKMKLTDYDDNDHIFTVNCIGFTKVWTEIQSHI